MGCQAGKVAFCVLGGQQGLVSGNIAAGQIFRICVLGLNAVHLCVSGEPTVTKLKWADPQFHTLWDSS